MRRVRLSLRWLRTHPTAIITLSGIVILLGIFLHELTREIDVLEDWTIRTTQQRSGELPIYNPGGTLEFISSSIKLESAEGTTARIFECDPIGANPGREISLEPVLANRAPGENPPRENSILVPAVSQFNGLPRTCRLVINVCYNNVVLWRDHCEQAVSNDFLVREEALDGPGIQRRIDALEGQIRNLRRQMATEASMTPTVAETQGPDQAVAPSSVSGAVQGPTSSRPVRPSRPSRPPINTQPEPAPVEPGLIESIIDGVGDVIDELPIIGGR